MAVKERYIGEIYADGKKVESVDVMIERLQMLKKMMLGSREDLLALSDVEVPEDFKVEEWK